MTETKSPVLEAIREKFGEDVIEAGIFRGDEFVVVKRERVIDLLRFLKEDPGMSFEFLMDVTAVDWLGRKTPRFEVVYHLYSFSKNRRLRVKTPVPEEDPRVESATPLWKGANWFEREVYDMFGITFDGHPDLRRILLYDSFVGHPLRKDYPHDKRQPTVPTDEFPDPEKNVRVYIDEWKKRGE
ncbi:MAG: NADH-quinone oxidoreductase subunit C [Deltaproteobacteria bacterium]|nr:MAG: NADH-quinone oxidoreductase subunit C [Deltaproteobacteria bacterium]